VDDEWSWYDRNVVTANYRNLHLTQVVERKKDSRSILLYEKKGQSGPGPDRSNEGARLASNSIKSKHAVPAGSLIWANNKIDLFLQISSENKA
jgi:hypothetical protein